MNCKNSILDESFAPSATVLPQVTLQLREVLARMDAQDELITDLKAEIAALKAEKATSTPPVKTATEEVESPQQVPPVPDPAISEEIIQLRADLEMFNEARALEIATDRRRIAALEVPPEVHVQPKQRNQGDILRALLATTANGKMLQNTARAKMGISKSAFSRLLHTIEGSVKYEPYHKDRRQNVLVLVNKNE